MVRSWLVPAAIALVWPVAAAEPGIKTQFIGGTLPGIPAKADAWLDLTGADALSFRCWKTSLAVAWQKINTVEYGQNVSRRYAAGILISPVLLLSKSRKHFVTIGYSDDDGRQQALVLRVAKGDIRPLLAGLEARTGRRVEFQDEDARKSLKE